MASLWMLYASFAFAAMGAGVKLASEFYSTSELLMYRGLIGTLILLFMVRRQGGTFKTDFGKAHLWRSLVGVTSLWLWFFAIGRLPLATALVLTIAALAFAVVGVRDDDRAAARQMAASPPTAAGAFSGVSGPRLPQ